MVNLRTTLKGCTVLALMGVSSITGAEVEVSDVALEVAVNARPNVLFIPDTSESMQEGLSQGRVALDWDECEPGPFIENHDCPSGAVYEDSKASIVKRVGRQIVDDYRSSINMGLLSYQQYPASHRRNDALPGLGERPGTSRWRLVHRIADARFSYNENPDFYQPDHDKPWDSDIKRFREEHPTGSPYVFYNVAVPGYLRDEDRFGRWEGNEETMYCQLERSEDSAFPYTCYENQSITTWGAIYYNNFMTQASISLTDSMRQRGVDGWGEHVLFVELAQTEWRAGESPGLGYLHVPIGGHDEDGNTDEAHWQALETKLQPQRHDWSEGDPDATTDPDFPLIAAGLTPLEGTMRTATDYFLEQDDHFGPDQGSTQDDSQIPESCDVNAALWVTDGLPSVDADGTSLGDSPAQALDQAEQAIADFHEQTGEAFDEPVRTFVVGFALPPGVEDLPGMPDDPLDQLAQAGGTESAFEADDEDALSSIMDEIFERVVSGSVSASGITASTTELDRDAIVYQAAMNSDNWTGDLRAIDVNNDGTRADEPRWAASETLTDQFGAQGERVGSRTIVTNDPENGGVVFAPDELGSTFRDRLTDDADEQTDLWRERVAYIRGDRSLDEHSAFRNRPGSILGHIAKSEPVFVAGDDTRPDMIYVAANDGMVHGFNAQTGEEVMAFIPGDVTDNLLGYTQPEYDGQFVLDGQLDVRIDEDEATLVGTTGAGGESVFALDVSDPEDFGPSDFLWEYESDALGLTMGHPRIMDLANGDQGVIVSSGYNQQADQASLVVLELTPDDRQGNRIARIETDEAGLASPGVLDRTRNGTADFVYAGDFEGNLWRVDMTSESSDDWDLAGSEDNPGEAFFQTHGERPITSTPVMASHPQNGIMVVFGTGEYITVSAPQDNSTQAVYGLRDRFDGQPPEDLVEQRIIDDTTTHRVTSSNRVSDSDDGWYLELGEQGERVLSNPVLRRGEALIGSFLPSDDPCDAGGFGYLTVVDAFTGARQDESMFDIDADKDIGEINSVRTDGIIRSPAIIGNRAEDYVFAGEEDLELQSDYGRQFWDRVE